MFMYFKHVFSYLSLVEMQQNLRSSRLESKTERQRAFGFADWMSKTPTKTS